MNRELGSASLGDLRAYLHVDGTLASQATGGLVDVRVEVGRRLAAIAGDWTPTRTLGPTEREVLELAAELLQAGKPVVIGPAR